MKSTTTYEMHNYEANTAPSVCRSDTNNNESATININSGSEKYSLRQRQKPRNAVTESLTLAADSSGYLSDDNFDNSDQEYAAADVTRAPTKTKAKKTTTRKKAGSTISNSYNTAPKATSTPAKGKTKAAPLSKYRRKTANARERTRMREINSAFENLRHCVPHTITGDESVQSSEKLTKITTLRLAMKYISILSEALTNPSFEADFLLECKRDGDHRFTTHNWQQQPLSKSDEHDEDDDEEDLLDIELEPEPELPQLPAVKTKSAKSARVKITKKNSMAMAGVNGVAGAAAATAVRKAPVKRLSKKQKLQQSISPYSSHSSAASTCSSLSTSAYASLSSAASSIAAASPPCSSASNSSYLLDSPVNSAYINNVSQSMSDLSSLMLESDGESLHLSEPCLSPSNYRLLGSNCAASTLALLDPQHQQTADALNPYDQACDQHGLTLSSLENPLELSLRLLDSSADSLDFASGVATAADQHAAPSSCLSPLVTLDSFNPFADLLHSDFPEHSALDIFLT